MNREPARTEIWESRDRYKRIMNRVRDFREDGILTSTGEKMSLAAIGRTVDPPVHRVSMQDVAKGKTESRRLKEAINRELKRPFFYINAKPGEKSA